MDDVFTPLRSLIGEPRLPNLLTKVHDDELNQMPFEQGLFLIDAKAPADPRPSSCCPDVTVEMKEKAHLWAVRQNDAVHAAENCDFGKSLALGKIKHTNLTGGEAAYIGGELIWLGEQEIIINGCSGRYKPQSALEIESAGEAFTYAGYRVWSTGYDEGTGYCFRFGASVPVEVQPK
ncbi:MULTISPECIES: hypothetical protein [Pseudomonas]|uniref:hypothetical protein n=1 Tax=Pseudomonas TaxID=286 RepID=UPI0013E0AB2B|nr:MULTISPECIES: hypothetical protein [Pseudomonas]MCE0908265.1 hypothetical protein [Pseudomonas kurunegalensis]QIG20700.1 hypothetical protein FY041_24550 [Pseudomonas monteilii]QIG25950.1 hypothetical protein FY043_24545 [Pseudomonas monteilii]WJR55351.1 hypothetical protein LU664_023910 [Pseudomonas kurunegalensis]